MILAKSGREAKGQATSQMQAACRAKASFASAAKQAGFNVTVAKVIEDGRSNIREILHISQPLDVQTAPACKRQKVGFEETENAAPPGEGST